MGLLFLLLVLFCSAWCLMLIRLKRNNACTRIPVSEIVHQYVGTEYQTIKTSLELSEVAYCVLLKACIFQ